jgi:hypothetical protein
MSRRKPRRRPRRAVPLALLALALCLTVALEAPAGSKRPGKHKRPPAAPLYWGAQIGDQLTGEKPPWDMAAVYKLERLVRKRLSVISFSGPFAECRGGECDFIGIPLFGWSSSASPAEADQSPYRLAKVLDGSFDSYIRYFAESARDWGHPFFMRFDWEMNGFWFPWSEGVNGNRRGQFVAAWRHVHDIFDAVGADNVTWVWCPNVDFTHKLIPLRRVYPGHAYVDWTCLNGFNWGRRPDSAGWQSFNQIFHDTYRRVVRIAPRKPMMIGEVASNEVGGSKPAWIRNMLRIVPARYRKIRALVWFDVEDRNTNWPIETSRRSRRAFSKQIRRRVFRPSVFGGIARSPIRPPGRRR